MAALSITSLVSFFGNEQKSLTRGENHYKSNHVESFTYSDGIIRGVVWTLKDFVVLEIYRDNSWAEKVQQLRDFYLNHLFPKIVEGEL